MHERKTISWLMAGVGILAVAAALRLFGLELQSLWYDEGVTLRLIQADDWPAFARQFVHEVRTTPISERFQPLYFPFLFIWSQAAGTGDFSLRLLSAVFGISSVGMIMAIGWIAFSPRSGIFSGLLAGLSAYGIYYAQEVRPYALAMLLCTAGLYLFVRAYKAPQPSPGLGAAFAVTCALAVLSNIFSGVLFAALAVSQLVLNLTSLRNWLRLWIPAGVLSLLMLLGWLATLGFPTSAAVPEVRNFLFNLLFVPYGLLVGQTYGPPLTALRGQDPVAGLSGSMAALVILGILLAVISWLIASRIVRLIDTARSDGTARLELCLWVALAFGFMGGAALAYITHLNWLPRHAFYLFPVLMLLLPRLVERPIGRASSLARGRRIAVGLIALCLLAVGNIYATANYFFDPRHARDDYRAAASYLSTLNKNAGPVVLLWGEPALLRHYKVGEFVDGRAVVDPARAGAALVSAFPNEDGLTLVLNRAFYWNKRKTLAEAVAPEYRIENRRNFINLDVYKVRRTKGPSPLLTPGETGSY